MKLTAVALLIWVLWPICASAAEVSSETGECIECHRAINPGMVRDWEKSRHAQISVQEALKRPPLERRVSVEEVPGGIGNVVIGCVECHTLNPEKHADTFEHAGYDVHVVVTPKDCSVCHPTEVQEYGQNLMSHAYKNLNANPVYRNLADTVNGIQVFENMQITLKAPDAETEAESCNYCHGTVVEVRGFKERQTVMDEMIFPVLAGWPNQGVGRINPDGSMGSCAACHTRHAFSIEMARKPHTCSQCHKGPDVPAYPVYTVSKHGNIYAALRKEWDFENVPWTVGRDFTAPTCAACHVSLLVNGEGEAVTERTHQMNNRLPWRIFGLIYAHPHPKSSDTTIIRNNAGLPLPTELTGEPASDFVIGTKEQTERRDTMQKVCLSCHSYGWVDGQWERFENTVKTANEMTLTATQIMVTGWEKGVARGLAQNDSIFNEAIEKKWMDQWLFYGNSTRFASAMVGADYGVFANGRWKLAKNVQELLDLVEFKLEVMRGEK